MVKLDVSLLRFLEDEDFRVITALEMAMRNHELAPTALIERIAQLPHGGARKRLQSLLKSKMIHHENTVYDGYSMKYGAYDFLALRAFSKRGTVTGVGTRIGCGKESDIILVQDEHGQDCVMKLQRLGRCSFRTVTRNRDYKGNGKTRRGESWFYLSRLAATKEFAFMKMLYDEGFPVPKPIDHNRHAVVMEYLNATLLNSINEMDQAQKVYERCLALIVRLAEHGLVHGDFNEFNLLITDDYRVMMIDFPQMVSTDHRNAEELFDRDVQNLANFFTRRFRVETLFYPCLSKDVERSGDLDRQAFASGFFSKKQQIELEKLMEQDAEEDADEEEEEEDDEEAEHEDVKGAAPTANADEAPVAETKKAAAAAVAKRTAHIDPSTPPDEGDEASEREENVGSDDDDEASSGDDTIAQAKKARLNLRRDVKDNPNLVGKGQLNAEYIKNRVKNIARKADDREFNRTVHRNAQKGREKKKISRELKNGTDFSLFD